MAMLNGWGVRRNNAAVYGRSLGVVGVGLEGKNDRLGRVEVQLDNIAYLDDILQQLALARVWIPLGKAVAAMEETNAKSARLPGLVEDEQQLHMASDGRGGQRKRAMMGGTERAGRSMR